MITLLNSLPEWVLALLGVLLLLIAALYIWILINWLALRQRVFELVEQNGELTRTVAAQAPSERLYEDTRREMVTFAPASPNQPHLLDDEQIAAHAAEREAAQIAVRNLQNQLNVAHAQLAQSHRAIQLRQVALDEAHRRLITYESTIAELQATARQAQPTPSSLANTNLATPVESAPAETGTALVAQPVSDNKNEIVDDASKPAPPDTAQLQAATALIAARDAQVAELETQVAELHTQLDNAHDEIKRASVQLDEQRSTQASAAPVAGPTTQLAAGVPALATVTTHRTVPDSADGSEWHNELALAQNAMRARDATIAELKTQLGNVRTSLEMAREALQARDMELAQLKAAPVAVNEADTGAQLSQAHQALATREAELSEALAKVDAQNATIADLLGDVQAANEDLALQKSRLDNLSAQLAEMEAAAERAMAAERTADFADTPDTNAADPSELEQQLHDAQAAYIELDAQVGTLRERVEELEAQLQHAQAEADKASAKSASRGKRIDALKAQLDVGQAGMATEMPSLMPALNEDVETNATVLDGDALTSIFGIGVIDAQRLNEAGIHTYKALAKSKRSQLEKIIQPSKLRKIDFDVWIEQAKAKAKAARR